MRARISPSVTEAIRRVALQRGRSDQEATNLVISTGLATLGASLPSAAEPDQPSQDGTYKLTVPLPAARYSAIRHLAKNQGCSGRAMTRTVIDAGLRALGAWPPLDTAADV
jgi:hypothetical protein